MPGFVSEFHAQTSESRRFSWNWLWSTKRDLAWNLLPFWMGLLLAIALFLTRHIGPTPEEPMWVWSFFGEPLNVLIVATALYLPFIDRPHIWATLSRTYLDAGEWAERRWLFISGLLAFFIGPAIILLPYAINRVVALPDNTLVWGMKAWRAAFAIYLMHHINRQHWGFVALYRRKNDETSALEGRIDFWFFQVAIWATCVALHTGPWTNAGSGLFRLVFGACHVVFVVLCIGYVYFQFSQWRRGVVRNGPKLLYVASILSLYYLTLAFDARLVAFWVLITGTGHCVQYHAVVWAYGKKKYADQPKVDRGIPHRIFDHFWLYALLSVAFAQLTIWGMGTDLKTWVGELFQGPTVMGALAFVDTTVGKEVGLSVGAAFITGLRVHHFYIDSKIWRVGKSRALARNLSV